MPPLFASPHSVTVLRSRCHSPALPHHAVPSGDEMVEERGVPVHEDWSMAPDDDRVRFSLSGVAPHSWKRSPWGGWDGGYSAWMAHLLQASLWMEEEPGGATPASLWSQASPKPAAPPVPQLLSSTFWTVLTSSQRAGDLLLATLSSDSVHDFSSSSSGRIEEFCEMDLAKEAKQRVSPLPTAPRPPPRLPYPPQYSLGDALLQLEPRGAAVRQALEG